jgi:hypothetical protein
VIDLLAITDAGVTVDPPVVAVPSDGVSVLCTPSNGDGVDADALWRHEELLEGLMKLRPLLPVRYGTRVPDEAAAAAAVAGRGAELMARLDHVRGAVEVSVRVRPAAPAPPTTAEQSGVEYLRARTAASRAGEGVHEVLEPHARDCRLLGGAEPLRAAYLVEHDEVDAFAARVRELQGEHPELAILCTGPWPPYSFSEAAS